MPSRTRSNCQKIAHRRRRRYFAGTNINTSIGITPFLERHQRIRISSETRSKPNRSALGSSNSKYSDPWARNPSMRKPASSPNSNYGNRRSTQKRRHKSRSSSSSSSRPTIPDDVDYDSERFKSYRSRDKLAKRDSKDDRRDRGDKNRHANSRRNSTRSMSQSSSYSSEIRKAGSKRRLLNFQ